MESEGKAAGGRAVQQRLILWLSVCGIVGFFVVYWFLRVQLWDFLRICPTWQPSIPHKKTLAEKEYLQLHTAIHIQKREGICHQYTEVKFGRNEDIPQCGILQIILESLFNIGNGGDASCDGCGRVFWRSRSSTEGV
jgi:hypothetical protein